MFGPRALIWSAIVVAVAVIIRFNAPPQNVNREQAGLDKDKPGAAAADKDEKRKKSNVEPSWRGPADAPKQAEPKEAAPKAPRRPSSPRAMRRKMIVTGQLQSQYSPAARIKPPKARETANNWPLARTDVASSA